MSYAQRGDDTLLRDIHLALLFVRRMCCSNHPAEHSLRPHRHQFAVGETAFLDIVGIDLQAGAGEIWTRE